MAIERVEKRAVVVSGRVPGTSFGAGKPAKLWAFGYADLAALWGVSEKDARAIVGRGVNPGNLQAVCQEWKRRVRGN